MNKTFKQFFESKGAFKEFPEEQQPQRIPLTIYNRLADYVKMKLDSFGNVFIPSPEKSVGKSDTGDLDVIIDPHNRNTWREDIKSIFKDNIIIYKSNGPQLMTVMKDLIDNNQYMIDFILAKEGSFDYRVQYAKYGVLIPAVVGCFARSLEYKFDQDGFFIRIKNNKGNYSNQLITTNFDEALKIMMLDPKPFHNGELYTPQQVAIWITSSPRFDSKQWNP